MSGQSTRQEPSPRRAERVPQFNTNDPRPVSSFTTRDSPILKIRPIQMTWLNKDLERHNFAYLTTTGRVTGGPHRIEIRFVILEGSVWVNSGGGQHSDWVKTLWSTATSTPKRQRSNAAAWKWWPTSGTSPSATMSDPAVGTSAVGSSEAAMLGGVALKLRWPSDSQARGRGDPKSGDGD